MNIKYFLLCLLISFVSFASAQIQVSDVEYYLDRDDYPRKGFVAIEDDEYYITQGVDGTKIFLVTDNGLDLKHDLNYRPTDSTLNNNAYSYANSNSGLIYENEFLYELYWNAIYVINILTGELHEVIDLNEKGVRLQSQFTLGESFMYFQALDCGLFCKVRYDRVTQEIEVLEKPGLRVDDGIYNIEDSLHTISYYDLEENIEVTVPFGFSNISSMSRLIVAGENTLLVRDDNGITMLQEGSMVGIFNCQIPDSLSILSIYNDQVFCVDRLAEYPQIIMYDQDYCIPYPFANLGFFGNAYSINYSFKELGDQYVLYGYVNDWQGIGCYLFGESRHLPSYQFEYSDGFLISLKNGKI